MGQIKPLSGALGKLEKESSALRYDLRQSILEGKQFPTIKDHQDAVATKALSFLQTALPVLERNGDVRLINAKQALGGSLRDVALHIKDMTERELCGADRPVVEAKNGGSLSPRFSAAYFPDVSKPEKKDWIAASDDHKRKLSGKRKRTKVISDASKPEPVFS